MKLQQHRFSPIRWICLSLALFLLLPTLLACSSSSKPVKPSKQDITVVATCDGTEIYYEELRYLTLAFKQEMAATYGESIWTDAALSAQYLPELWDTVTEKVKINCAILGMSRDFSIDINSDEIQESVQKRIDETVELMGGRKEYLAQLEELGMTDHWVRLTIGADACESALSYVLMDMDLIIDEEKEFIMWALDDAHTCAAFHIFIENNEGESVDENRQRAQEVRNLLIGGTPITDLIGSAYNDDIEEGKNPYYFFHGEYDEAYENAAWALPVGGISEVVETDDGFYVIVRQELSSSYVAAHYEDLMQRYQYQEVENLLADYRKGLTVEWNDYAKSLDLAAMQ